MTFPFALLSAMLISMALIPIMIRLAPRIGMVDMPDPRKVHARPVPRVGGVGIVIGALLSLLLWMPAYGWMPWFIFGSVVLFVFGAWDDSRELGHYVKFIGQFVATSGVVYGGDLWVRHLPFMEAGLDPAVGKVFTVFALVGMINAINHSDGLDGLAGGESLMSLGCLAYLAYLGGGGAFVVAVAAVIGGLFGFLRFNSHPARVFMGDSGSQFLGFALGVLTVALTQEINPGLSMALPALILGLPIVDILAVFAQRIHGGMNWFRATKNHVHHRLLALGFSHPKSVLIIYAVQAFLVLSAIVLRYESDALILGTYLVVCGGVFGGLIWAERTGWRYTESAETGMNLVRGAGSRGVRWLLPLVWMVLLSYFLIGGVLAREVSSDIGVAAALAAVLAAVGLILTWRGESAFMVLRLGVFCAAALLVYTLERQSGVWQQWLHPMLGILAVAAAVAIRSAGEKSFRTTPLDYLMILLVLAAGFLAQQHLQGFDLGWVMLKLVVLFYSFELIASCDARSLGTRLVGVGACCAGALLATRALL